MAATRKNVDKLIKSLETVIANGHTLIPVKADDLRMLIEAARRATLP